MEQGRWSDVGCSPHWRPGRYLDDAAESLLSSAAGPITPYFYMAVALLPALITFFVSACARPIGNRLMLVALPIFASVIFVIYLILIGPGFYNDIQCGATSASGPASHLDCRCRFETISGKGIVKCSADRLSPLPLIRLVEEEWGVP